LQLIESPAGRQQQEDKMGTVLIHSAPSATASCNACCTSNRIDRG
jgi:hypothetical protein